MEIFTNMWKLNHTLTIKGSKKKSKGKSKSTLRQTKMKPNYQNLWYAAKTVLRGKLIMINAYIKKMKDHNKQPMVIPKKLEKKTN